MARAMSEDRPPSASRPDILDILPHRPPMRLIDEIVSVGGQRVTCRSTIRADHILFRASDGRVPALVTIELFAQSAAALMMHRASQADASAGKMQGVLLGARLLDFAVDAFEVGDVLLTHLEVRYISGAIVQLRGTVERDGAQVASGAINVSRA